MISTGEHEHCLAPGCARPLRSKASRARGYGSGCWRRIRSRAAVERLAPALAVFTGRQAGQARELIEDGAAVPGYDGVLYCVSTDGTEVYETTAGACSCPASRECYHQAAVIMLSAGRPAAAPRSSLAKAA